MAGFLMSVFLRGGWRIGAAGAACLLVIGGWMYVQNLRADVSSLKENLSDAQSTSENLQATILREREVQRNIMNRLELIETARRSEGPGGCLSKVVPADLFDEVPK